MQQYEKNHGKTVPEEIKPIIDRLRSPKPLTSLGEIDTLVKPLPGYIGPGEWLALVK